jgi:predicted N-formylglutamate amidohydrolase
MRAAHDKVTEIVHPGGRPDILLLCDHASNRMPEELAGLGLDAALLGRHIGWDIGAGDLTRRLADLLDAPAVLGRFSRLVIDPNRALDHPQSVPRVSDGVAIPGNRDVDAAEAGRRAERYFHIYHRAIGERIEAALARATPTLIGVHSFTPIMDGFERPWHAAVLHDDDVRLARAVLASFARYPDLVIGDNEPYTGYSNLTFTVPYHAGRHGLASVVLEVRQDLIDTPHGVERWAFILKDVLAGALADAGPSRQAAAT